MRICFFAIEHHSLGSGGGIASYLEAVVPELVRLGNEVHIIVKGGRSREYCIAGGGIVHEFKGGNVHWYVSKIPLMGKVLALPVRELEWSWGFFRRFEKIKKKYRCDLIESSETGNLVTSLFERSVPLGIRLHGSTYAFENATRGKASFGAELDRILQRISFRRAKGISSPSEAQKRIFQSELGESFAVRVIPNPVTKHSLLQTHQAGAESSIGARSIFYAGRIADVKGVWPLLMAFVEVATKCPEVRLIMAGGAHPSVSRNALDGFMEAHRIADKVKLLGHVPREKIDEYYEMCTVYVVPSFYETFCISAVEAMLHGKPVVASSKTSLEEIVEDGRTGLLVPPGDIGALAEALLNLLTDDEMARRMGEAGMEKAAQYRPAFIAEKTLKFYESVVAGKNVYASELR